jgi:hypothetical protein
MYPSYDDFYDEEPDWSSQIFQMANTIDALNTNIILLNRFISSAYNLSNNSNNFNENVEITTFDTSGNIVVCLKSDGSGNFIPCVHMDASGNMLPCVLPPMSNEIQGNHIYVNSTKKDRGFCDYPYYNHYYNPYYTPYYSPYYSPYYGLLDDDNYNRDVDVSLYAASKKKPIKPIPHPINPNKLKPPIKKPTIIPHPIKPNPIIYPHPISPPKSTNVHVHIHP